MSGRRRGGVGVTLFAEDGECSFEYLQAYYLDRHRMAEITVQITDYKEFIVHFKMKWPDEFTDF